jgi:hypothetical protein
MRHEGSPESIEPNREGQQEEIKWVIRKDGEPLDIHIRRNEAGDVISSSMIFPIGDAESLLKITFRGEVPKNANERLQSLARFLTDMADHPEKFRRLVQQDIFPGETDNPTGSESESK